MSQTISKRAEALGKDIVPKTASNVPPELHHQTTSLPDQPVVTVAPTRLWVALDLRDFWVYRELLYFLTWRDLKVRYKQTLIGITWVVLQPLLMTLVFTVFLGMFARVPSDGPPYPLFAYSGLLLWLFFSSTIGGTSNSLVGSANLITKIYFPRLIIPTAATAARLVDLVIGFIILIGLMIYYHSPIHRTIVMLPVIIAMISLLALAIGMWTSALNVKYRDVGVVMPVLIQLWMFASPIVYPSTLVPAKYRWLYNLNPLAAILEGFRACLFGRQFDWPALSLTAAVILALLAYSAYEFRRMEKSFADMV
jgi:lipopolysaccharide transport system permease protein